MEESQEILLKSLENSGVEIPRGVSAIKDLTPATLVSICAQSLRLIEPTSSFPAALPDSMADRFKICSDLASAVTNLGFIGDMNFHKFLYPSEEDLYKLVRFLLKKLSELPEEVEETADKRNIITSTTTKENAFEGSPFKESTEKDENNGIDQNVEGVRTGLKDLRLNTEMPASSNSRSEDAFVSGPHKADLIQHKIDKVAILEISKSRMHDASKEDVKNEQDDDKESIKILSNSRVDSSEESSGQMDDKHDLETEQKLNSLRRQSSEIRYKTGKLRSREKVLMEEESAKSLEAQHLEEEHGLLKSVVEMVFDDQHTAEFYIAQLTKQVDARRGHLMELETQWDTLRKPLEEKRRSLEEALYASNPGALEKLKKLKEIELETEAILSETKKREEEHYKLLSDLENQPRLSSRRSYIQRITEITKNSRKQDADIERILKETRELQKESNYIQERLNRTYAVADEMVFREAKKDPVGRQAYRLLTSIHDSFEQISDKILSTDRIQREVAEHEAKLSALARRSFNIEKLQADLDVIRRENEFLEHHLHDS